MNKQEKGLEIESLKKRLVNAQFLILAEYKGIKVESFNQLRRKLHEKNSLIKVVKNRLAKLALKGTPMDILESYFKGTTAVASTESDPTGPAKVIADFLKDNEQIKFKAAYMNGELLSQAQVTKLAKLPSREELIAKMLGSMMAPARNWVSVLAQIPRQWVNVLAAVRDQKEKGS